MIETIILIPESVRQSVLDTLDNEIWHHSAVVRKFALAVFSAHETSAGIMDWLDRAASPNDMTCLRSFLAESIEVLRDYQTLANTSSGQREVLRATLRRLLSEWRDDDPVVTIPPLYSRLFTFSNSFMPIKDVHRDYITYTCGCAIGTETSRIMEICERHYVIVDWIHYYTALTGSEAAARWTLEQRRNMIERLMYQVRTVDEVRNYAQSVGISGNSLAAQFRSLLPRPQPADEEEEGYDDEGYDYTEEEDE